MASPSQPFVRPLKLSRIGEIRAAIQAADQAPIYILYIYIIQLK